MTDADRRLRVAIATETYPPEINGVANTLGHLVEGLAGRGHEVHLVRPRQGREAPPPASPTRRVSLVPGLPIPGYRGLQFGLPVYWRLRRLWRQDRPSVVYIATQGPLGHAALTAARSLGIPSLTGFHTQFHQYSRHYGVGLLTRPIVRTLRRFHNRSDATLVPTPELRDGLIAQGFRNVYVLGRGVDTTLFSPQRRSAALRCAWGARGDTPTVIYVGRLAAEKNLTLGLTAFRAIERVRPEARFVLIGDGPAREPLERAEPDLIFTGAKVGVELAEHYASGDLFVFPSLTETFGNVVPEAMASGLAVVAFDYAAAAACICSWEDGVTVPMGDETALIAAAVAVAEDGERRRALGAAARARAETLGWDRVLNRVEDLLFTVVRRRGGREAQHEAMAATSE
ncbi:MAG: glycosyltransferase family 1 protein [Chromatiaceae bacterium]|nr:glycosyltransferase family 1 protein [Chromatiaceae bacterium]